MTVMNLPTDRETITVKYINQPKDGKKRGSIKTTDDVLLGVQGDPVQKFGFEIGGTYEVEFTDNNGWLTIFKATPIGAKAPTQPRQPTTPPAREPAPGNGNGNGKYGATDNATAERIYVCGALNAAISGGRVNLDAESIERATLMFMEVYRATLGEPLPPTRQNGSRELVNAH